MIINRVYQYIKRKIQRKVEYEQYYKNSYNQIKYQIKEKQKICWFIGSAHYDNIGDQAISLYTTNFLEDLGFFVVDIRLCDYYKYLKALRKIVKKDDMIVLQGGGNMGYTYFDAEFNRREVIKSFPKNKIVIFPCTIDYGNSLREKKELERAKRIYNRHTNLTICAREKKSYQLMKEYFHNNKILFIPDIVLYSKFINFTDKRNGICLCLRNDNEKTEKAKELKKHLLNYDTYNRTDNVSVIKNISIEEREKIVLDKLKEYAQYELVITDRLHTMIFCYITQTPCLFLDNSNGKVSRVFENWIEKECNYILKIEDISKINELIKKLRDNTDIGLAKNCIANEFCDLKMEFEEMF